MDDRPAAAPEPARAPAWRGILPGLLPPAAIAAVAMPLGSLVPLVGAPVFALVLGVLVGTVLHRSRVWPVLAPGAAFAGKRLLQLAIVVLGVTVPLGEVARIGAATLPVLLGTLVVALLAAWLLARLLGIEGRLGSLIGVGTSICGASAIAAIAPIVAAPATLVALAVTTVFTYNLAAVLLFPSIGHLLGLSQEAFGLFAGTAVNDTSSVVAAASIYGPEAAQTAVIVKLARTLMIVPISVGLAMLLERRPFAAHAEAGPASATADAAPRPRKPAWRLVPWFIIGFVLAAALATTGLFAGWDGPLHLAATALITTALAAIGLETDLAAFRRAGWRPLALGGLLWIVVTLSCLGLMAATGWL